MANDRPIIIVKKKRKGVEGHHGGAWKVAYADFVTAMMAFFLVMWLVTAVSKEQRAAIFDYFKNPSMEQGKSSKPAPGQMGPGGSSTSPINLGGGLDSPRVRLEKVKDIGATTAVSKTKGTHGKDGGESDQQAKEQVAEAEHKKLESLMVELRAAISKSQALEPFKDQLLLDITSEGIRIQIVDAQNRPMFDIGSAHLRDYTQSILRELAPYLSSVPNRISITGHTDIRPYPGQGGYSNWELSADRANAARRALVNAGLPDEKIARVVGLSSSVLFDKQDPQNAINRRISIVIMTKQAEADALKTDEARTEPQGPVATPPLSMPEDVIPVGTAPAGPMSLGAVPAAAPAANTARTAYAAPAPANTAQASLASAAPAATRPAPGSAPTAANPAPTASAMPTAATTPSATHTAPTAAATPGATHTTPTATTSMPGATHTAPTAATSTPGATHTTPTAATSMPGTTHTAPTATTTPGASHTAPAAAAMPSAAAPKAAAPTNSAANAIQAAVAAVKGSTPSAK